MTNLFKNLADDEGNDGNLVQSAAVCLLLHVSIVDSSGRRENTIIIFLNCSSRAGLISGVQIDKGSEWELCVPEITHTSKCCTLCYSIFRVTDGNKTFMHAREGDEEKFMKTGTQRMLMCSCCFGTLPVAFCLRSTKSLKALYLCEK